MIPKTVSELYPSPWLKADDLNGRVATVTITAVDIEDIRHNPGLTKIPYYAVDAVVHAPFGAYPGECPGHYASDTLHVIEVFGAVFSDRIGDYLEKWVYGVPSEAEMLERRVGVTRLRELEQRATVREGFRP